MGSKDERLYSICLSSHQLLVRALPCPHPWTPLSPPQGQHWSTSIYKAWHRIQFLDTEIYKSNFWSHSLSINLLN